MTIGLIGRKVGMTQIFQADGTMIPVSVVIVEPNTVTRLRTPERDGYSAVQLGVEESGKLNKPEMGQLKNLPKVSVIREFRLEADATDAYTVGQKLDVTLFAAGDIVNVTGVSKGKGFSGHIKRHHFKRGPKTHGSDLTAPRVRSVLAPRRAGSTRACGWPAIWVTPVRPSSSCGSSVPTQSATCCSSRGPFPVPPTGCSS